MRVVLCALAIVAAACNGSNGGGDDISGMPDLADGLTANPDCETRVDSTGVEQSIPGATTFFIGEFSFNGEDVSGVERRVLLANEEWDAGEGFDCEVVWNVAGLRTDTFSCTTCDFGLQLDATLDRDASTCVAGLVSAEPGYQELQYDVRVGDNSADFTFPSGTQLGSGPYDSDWVTYVTDPQCSWF